jgi:probable O-glycosylation ligase (exosortase A-associated)
MLCVLALTTQWPLIGAITYVWLSTAHPQTGNTGFFAWQWPLITITVFFASYLVQRHKVFSLRSSVFSYIFLFYCWTTLTSFFALAPEVGWGLWWDFTRLIVTVLLIGGTISNRRDLNLVVWAMLAGVASIMASGLIQVALSGGRSAVQGVQGSEFFGTNEVARLFGVAGLPYALFLSFHAQHPLLRKICRAIFVGCIIAIVGTFSRGAFIALAATFLFWALISRRRWMLVAQASALVVIVAVLFTDRAADAFLSRMQTIQDYQNDGSFQGRLFAWDFALRTVAQRPITGGGFGVFRLDENPQNTSGEGSWRDAHSVYFETLGEHGYVGLALYLLVVIGAFLKASAIKRQCKGNPALYWERDLAIAVQLSLVFHLVGGLTISATYVQYTYFTLMIVAVLDKITRDARVQFAARRALTTRSAVWKPGRPQLEQPSLRND